MNVLFEVCWMAVEPRYAAEVEALLQSLRGRDLPGEAEAEPNGTERAEGGRRRNNGEGVVWQAPDYDAFMAAAPESYRRVRAFADVLAASPEQPFTTTAVYTAAGIKPTQLRAALGKFTTWMKATINESEWPFGWADGVNLESPGEFHYTMNAAQATAWTAARQRAHGTPQEER